MAEAWTVRRMLDWMRQDFLGREIETARLDAELLVADALGLERIKLYLDLDRPLSKDELDDIRARVQRRRKREPVAYILGRRDFYGRTFEVGPDVLVPRPDTETLVERALTHLPAESEGPILDMATGSGCIGVTLAAERPQLRVDATDICAGALTMARRNADKHGVSDRMRFFEGDLFAPLGSQKYPLVLVNPPYLGEAELSEVDPDVRDFEPTKALVAGPTGLEVYERIIPAASKHLESPGVLLLEVGYRQAEAVSELVREAGYKSVVLIRDHGGIDRVVEAHRN